MPQLASERLVASVGPGRVTRCSLSLPHKRSRSGDHGIITLNIRQL